MKKVLLEILIGILLCGLGLGVYYYFFKEDVNDEAKEEKTEQVDQEDVVETETLIEEAKQPVDVVCDMFDTHLLMEQTLSNHKINSCKLIKDCNNDGSKLIVNINYDVTTVNESALNEWLAGNGMYTEGDLTIYGKSQFFAFEKAKEKYKLLWSATAIGEDACN